MKLHILLKCEEASHICDKSQYSESSRAERLLMKMHHLMCRVCREHSAMNSKLSMLIKKARISSLPEESRKQLKARIQQELSR